MDLPRQLGPYRLVRRLGAGGMAEVFLAQSYGASGFERRVAIKTLLPALRGDATFERILIEEARVASRLAHRNLVAVQDLGVARGEYFVVMEFVDGSDLATLANGHAIDVALALHFAEQIAAALDCVHDARDEEGRPLGLVHRDVSPSNILVSHSGDVKLGDFGVAKATLLADITQSGVRKGKYAYMSPEQVTGGAIEAASDQFGLGVTLCELITGSRPFDGQGPLDTMERIRAAERPDLAAVPDDVRAIVMRLLAKDPSARFESAAAVCNAIAEVRRQRPLLDARAVGQFLAASKNASSR